MNKLTRYIINIIFNSVLFVAIYYSYFKTGSNVNGAQNVVCFIVWFSFIVSLMSGIKIVSAEIKKKGRVFPIYIEVPIDVLIVFIFVYNGSMLLGSLFVVKSILYNAIFWDQGVGYE